LTVSMATADPGSVSVLATTPTTQALAIKAAQEHLPTATPGVTYALPLCTDGTYRRRRVSLIVTDPSVELPETTGMMTMVPPATQNALLELATKAGVGPEPNEQLESVDVRAHRSRYKPVVTPHTGRTQRVFEAVEPTTKTVVATGATAGEARRNAVAVLKEGPLLTDRGPLHEYSVGVYQCVGRQDNNPLITIARTRVTRRASLRLSYLHIKNPDRQPKVTGWLFFGVADPTTTPEPEREKVDTEPDAAPEQLDAEDAPASDMSTDSASSSTDA